MSSPTRLTKLACAVTLLAAVVACTSLRPIDLDREQLRQEIRIGNLVRPGERVQVTTESGDVRAFRLEAIVGDSLVGDGVTVPIGEIAALEVREHDRAETAGAILGATALTWVLISALVSALVLPTM